ncbi:MAG: ABC transporter permease [Lachnospiraceae bacterium]|nr:ABC transporter permease [Lachnospiraceae bacterium]
MANEVKFEVQHFGKRLKSMLKVDFRRMFTMRFYYIMVGISIIMPVLILVMTTLMDGTTTVNPQTGVETTIEGFDNTWQAIGSISSESSVMDMSLTGMCNINMLYFFVAVLVCIFVADDFRSGYAKNLFTVRAKKTDYVISKTLAGFVGGASMILGFFIGTCLGGAISGLPFDTGAAGVNGVVMCMFAKVLLVGVFVPIYVLMGVWAKQKAWLSILGSLMVGMLFFTMIPMLTPLDSTIMNVVLCLVGSVLFGLGIGAISNLILKKKSIL